MVFIYIVLLFILQQSTINCQPKSRIYTCCKLQSSLDSSGFCEQPISEFDLHLYPQYWKVPRIITNEISSGLELELTARSSWCQCKKNLKIDITLKKRIDEFKVQWVVKNPESLNISLTPDGSLFSNGKEYGNKKYCLNKLAETDPFGLRQDEFDIELVICSESCVSIGASGSEFASTIVSKTTVDWITKIHDCRNDSGAGKYFQNTHTNATDTVEECNWATFRVKHDSLFLVTNDGNVTPIQDQTYPWAFLPLNTYCKIVDEKQDASFLKFCLTEIKKLFYGYRKLYAILAGVSAMFLLFNLTIYFTLRESLSISGWTEFFYSLALYIYCVLSIPALLIIPENTDIRSICYATSVLTQFFELATGATLVALSFDIWWTFRKFDKMDYTDDPKVSKLRMSVYFFLSLAVPVAIVCYGVSKNHRPWDFKFDDYSGVPQYGLLHCTAPDWPMASYTQFTMQGINLLLVLISAYTILNKDTMHLDSERRYLDPDRMDIFAKLFIFVFLFWIIDFMQFFLRQELFGTKWFLIAFQVFNYTQGIFAFFILVCNRKTLRGVKQKDWSLINLFQHACCSCARREPDDAEVQITMSPLMKRGSFRRSTVRGNAFY